ncbi:MAG: hypothetical protein ABMB14_25235 [Myxococcota bacterium]
MDLGWADELLSDTRETVAAIAELRVTDLEDLARQVIAYRTHVQQNARPMTDVETSDTLADAILALLDRAADRSDDDRALAAVAARYYVYDADADDDLASPFGFDDDREVFDAVAARIAPELVIAV